MEVYLSDQGFLFGEIALRPPGGYIMELISRACRFSCWEALVNIELGLPFEFNQDSVEYTAVNIVHPGTGRVLHINNRDQVADPVLGIPGKDNNQTRRRNNRSSG